MKPESGRKVRFDEGDDIEERITDAG